MKKEKEFKRVFSFNDLKSRIEIIERNGGLIGIVQTGVRGFKAFPMKKISDIFEYVEPRVLDAYELNLKAFKPALDECAIFNTNTESYQFWFYEELFYKLLLPILTELVDEDMIGTIKTIDCIEISIEDMSTHAYVNEEYTEPYNITKVLSEFMDLDKLVKIVKELSGIDTIEEIYLYPIGNYDDPSFSPLFVAFSTIYSSGIDGVLYSIDVFDKKYWDNDFKKFIK